MDLLDRLLEHDRWATARLLALSRDLTDARLDAPFELGHRTPRATLEHIVYYAGSWTALMAGQPVGDRRAADPVAALIERHERSHAAFAALARRVRDEGRLEETFVDHFGERMTFGGAILHVVLHNAEHRVEAVHMLARLGLPEPPEVDHGLWDHVRRGNGPG
jgi:uncharacterized damage-inducible protein DinB